MELSWLRDELEMAKISEEENSEAECAVLRSLRHEMAVQRQQDRAEFKHELQSERKSFEELRQQNMYRPHVSLSPNTSIGEISSSGAMGAPSPRRSLRTIVASHSHPKSEEAVDGNEGRWVTFFIRREPSNMRSRSLSLNLEQDHKLRVPTEFASTITSLPWKVLQPQATGNCSEEVGGFSRSP